MSREKWIGFGAAVSLIGGLVFVWLGLGWLEMLWLLALAVLCVAACVGWYQSEGARRQEQKAAAEREAAMQQAAAETVEAERHRSSEAMRQWQSDVTHSLRMPFSVILGYADLLKNDMVTDEAVRREYLSKIRDRIAYLNNVVSQLLMEARVTAEEPACVPEPVDLIRLARGIVEDMREVARQHGIRIQLVTGEESIDMQADPTQLTKLFYNLLENALKYMKRAGTVTITISRLGEQEVLLAFKDDGEGLPSKEAEHIFELNYQGSNREKGSGLGLHLVKNIVLAHGGTVEARSDVGKGMGIYIKLPVRTDVAEKRIMKS